MNWNVKFSAVGLLLAVSLAGHAIHALVPRGPTTTTSLAPWQPKSLCYRPTRLSLITRAATTYGSTTSAYTSQQSPGTIQDLFFFTNQERLRTGLPELRYNKELEKAAQRHAADMARNNYFSHDARDGSDLKDRVALTDYRYTNVGENLFWRTPDNDPAYAVQGWMESPGHRKNVLDQQFTEIGLGYAVDQANGKHYYVQVFGRPLDTPNVKSPVETRDTIFRATNEARLRQGLPPFSMSQELTQGAQEHAEDMMRSGKLTSKLKRGTYDRFFTQLGARFAAREIFNDPHGAVKGWLEKGPGSDILSERFTETGIGYTTDGEQHYYVQLFGSPMETGVGRRDFTRPGGQTLNPAIAMPQQTEEKLDKARNGDFGRMGFGKLNRDRRHDADELDDQWNDDRRVLAQFQNRRPLRPASPNSQRPGPSSQANMGRGDMSRGNDGIRPLSADGFDSSWDEDYKGTANPRNYRMGPPSDPRQASRTVPAGGGAQLPPMRSQQESMNPSNSRYGQMNRAQQELNNDYRNPGMVRSSRTGGSGQPRRATASAFGQPPQNSQNGNTAASDIHYQRYLQLNGGYYGGGRMEDEMMYGQAGMGMRGGPGMMGMYDQQQWPTPMRRDNYPDDRNARNQMRDPSAYGRYDFGQPHNQRVGPWNNDMMRSGPMNIGMGANSEHRRGEYYIGQYSRMGPMDYGWNDYGARGPRGIQPDNFGP